jgi:hypothetical protein
MDAIRLISAPIDPTSPSETSSQSTGLVHVPRTALATRTTSHSDTARPTSNDVWTVSVDDNGAFNFYAVPRQGSGRNTSSQWNNDYAGEASSSGWAMPGSQNAAAQYAFYAALAPTVTGQYVNVYA